MTSAASDFDQSFINRQRLRLLDSRRDLLAGVAAGGVENAQLLEAASGGSREMEDSAQDLMIREENRDLGTRLEGRIAAIDRALARIAAGTYGISATSGEVLPRARLEALPEASSEVE